MAVRRSKKHDEPEVDVLPQTPSTLEVEDSNSTSQRTADIVDGLDGADLKAAVLKIISFIDSFPGNGGYDHNLSYIREVLYKAAVVDNQ